MKLVVIGRGLAAMGLLWNVAKLKDRSQIPDKIYWIGHNGITTPTSKRDAHYCSFNSTALVARQGLERAAGPLGELLYRAYNETLAFIKEYHPPGVIALRRFHLDHGGDALVIQKKLFGSISDLEFAQINLGRGHEEEAFSFNPEVFLTWFEEKIIKELPQIEIIEDFVLGSCAQSIITVAHGEITFDKLANCSGAMIADFPGLKADWPKIPKKAVGHYLHWDQVEMALDESFCLSWKGHNLIYRHDDRTAVWGGSTFSDAIVAPRYKDLEDDLEELLTCHPHFRFQGVRTIRTGMRSKGSKRRPILTLSEDGNQLLLTGLYKNGWSLCHRLGADGVKALFNL